jgi:hypothetical protein
VIPMLSSKEMVRLKIPQWILFSAVFIVIMGFLLVLTQGLPIGDPDDWDHILSSQDTPWMTMLQNFFTPWSTSRNWVAQTDLIDQTIGSRLFHGIALKTVTRLFGHGSFPYYLFNKVIFFSGTVTILSILLFKLTRSLSLTVAGTVFYALVPSHYAHVLWNSVPETIVHFFLIVCVFTYVKLSQLLETGKRGKSFWSWLGLLFIAGWFCMKTKETAIILPLVLGSYSCIKFFRWRRSPLQLFGLLGTIVYLVLLVVPVTHLVSSSGEFGRVFNWDILVRMVFRNYDCGYDNEPTTAFFSAEQLFPVSIARTIGFFSLWALLLFTILYSWRRFFNKTKLSPLFFGHPLVGISVVWIIIELFLIGFFQPDPRYFSGTMIPITIVLVWLVHVVLNSYSGIVKRIASGVIFFSVIMTVYINFQHVIWLRQQIGQRSHLFYYMAESIFKDYFSEEAPLRRDVGLFYCPVYELDDNQRPRLKELTYHVTLDYQALNKTQSPSLDEFEQQASNGAIYLMTTHPNTYLNHSRIQLVKKLSSINQESVFERCLYKLKKKLPTPYYIFKYA